MLCRLALSSMCCGTSVMLAAWCRPSSSTAAALAGSWFRSGNQRDWGHALLPDGHVCVRELQTSHDPASQHGCCRVDPFSENSPIKKMAISHFPPDAFFVLRVVQLLRGLAMGMQVGPFLQRLRDC